jgi:hypothetical protein
MERTEQRKAAMERNLEVARQERERERERQRIERQLREMEGRMQRTIDRRNQAG